MKYYLSRHKILVIFVSFLLILPLSALGKDKKKQKQGSSSSSRVSSSSSNGSRSTGSQRGSSVQSRPSSSQTQASQARPSSSRPQASQSRSQAQQRTGTTTQTRPKQSTTVATTTTQSGTRSQTTVTREQGNRGTTTSTHQRGSTQVSSHQRPTTQASSHQGSGSHGNHGGTHNNQGNHGSSGNHGNNNHNNNGSSHRRDTVHVVHHYHHHAVHQRPNPYRPYVRPYVKWNRYVTKSNRRFVRYVHYARPFYYRPLFIFYIAPYRPHYTVTFYYELPARPQRDMCDILVHEDMLDEGNDYFYYTMVNLFYNRDFDPMFTDIYDPDRDAYMHELVMDYDYARLDNGYCSALVSISQKVADDRYTYPSDPELYEAVEYQEGIAPSCEDALLEAIKHVNPC
ncbi:MAG: hypothetical protein ABIA04_07300 [Pseudomonadota bacterium]